MRAWVLFLTMVFLTMGVAGSAKAERRLYPTPADDYIIYLGDALVTRPITLGATLVGGALYAVSLPFTYLAQSEPTALDVLVKAPAAATFTRCLGCPIGRVVR